MGNCLFNDKMHYVNTPTCHATSIRPVGSNDHRADGRSLHHQRLSQHLNPDPKFNRTNYIPTPKVNIYPNYNNVQTIPSYPSSYYTQTSYQRPPPINPEYLGTHN